MQQLENQNQAATATIHPETEVGAVTLQVADLRRSLAFYTQLIGLQPLQQDDTTAVLGAGKRPVVKLVAVPGAKRLARNATGLYHAAILLPTRHALAVKVAQLSAIGYPLGQSDHLVSEAFYLDDPDANGLELYRDRPRSEWTWVGKQVQMALDPIDFDSLFGEVPEGDPALQNPAMPVGTKLGHMHLRVGDIDAAEAFYHGVLGFNIVASMPSALFVSAGGYHHHIGMNTWESRGAKPPVAPSAGLHEFSIVLPDVAELDRLTKQIEAAGVTVARTEDSAELHDPWQNQIKLIVKDQLDVK